MSGIHFFDVLCRARGETDTFSWLSGGMPSPAVEQWICMAVAWQASACGLVRSIHTHRHTHNLIQTHTHTQFPSNPATVGANHLSSTCSGVRINSTEPAPRLDSNPVQIVAPGSLRFGIDDGGDSHMPRAALSSFPSDVGGEGAAAFSGDIWSVILLLFSRLE